MTAKLVMKKVQEWDRPAEFMVAICPQDECNALKLVFVELALSGRDSTTVPISVDTLDSIKTTFGVDPSKCSHFLISPRAPNLKNTYKRLGKIFKINWKELDKDVYNKKEELYTLFIPSLSSLKDVSPAVQKKLKSWKGNMEDEKSRIEASSKLIHF
jgi:hypothetical protein